MNKIRRFFYYLEYLLCRIPIFLINGLSLPAAEKFAEVMGSFVHSILKKRRQTALENLRQAFAGEKTEQELDAIARASMQNLIKVGGEFIRLPEIAKRPEHYFEIKNSKAVWEVLNQQKGLIFIVSH